MMYRLPGSRKVKTFGDSRKDNTFGVSFGDKYPSGVWGEFSKNVSSNIHDNVVALASFNGNFTVMTYLLFHICIDP